MKIMASVKNRYRNGVSVTFTPEQFCTVKTALRLEIERLWGKDDDAIKALKDALSALEESL